MVCNTTTFNRRSATQEQFSFRAYSLPFQFNMGFEKNSENAFFPWIEKLMVLSDSAPQELSNEWSCQYVSTISNFGQFLCPALGDRSQHQSLKSQPSIMSPDICYDDDIAHHNTCIWGTCTKLEATW
jgi:hypothetical protein